MVFKNFDGLNMEIILDDSWLGFGGIGRFSSEVNSRLFFSRRFCLNGRPASPTSIFKLSKFVPKGAITFLPGYLPPFYPRGQFAFTIHDLNHIDRPENSNLLKKLFYRVIVKRGCRKAYKVLTVSEFSKKRIIEWSGVSSDKVVNVGNGVDKAFNSTVESYNLGSPYFLCVGNRKAHKNEARVVEAFAHANIDESIQLIFTGLPTDPLESLISQYGLKGRVTFMGNVSEDTLPSLYKGARSLLFPSLYEGFGLPVLEAMACGTPVITSNCTSLPEVAGGAALLVDPLDTQELQVAIEQLEKDTILRENLVEKGFERARLFTWERTAQKVQEVLDSAQNT
jgi:glycosyltransferase involved in cell wall biosynthesis